MALVFVFTALASENIAQDSIPIVKDVPSGYRDWKLISMAHEEGNLHSFAAVLGNDIAINAYREGKLPLPDGAIIVALHYRHVPSEENNKVFGQAQSFVPGPPTNMQFMVKDSKNMPQPAVGRLLNSTTVSRKVIRQCLRAASSATRQPKIATLFLLIMHLDPTSDCVRTTLSQRTGSGSRVRSSDCTV